MDNMINNTEVKQRYDFIDVLRIIACFLVIVNHSSGFVFSATEPSPTWFAAIAYFFVSKMAVPIFVMITGYLMMDRQDDYVKSIKRVFRMSTVLVLFTLAHYMLQWYTGTRLTVGVIDFIACVLRDPIIVPYWYLYTYIGILIMMPFLQKFVTQLSKKDCEIFLIITLTITAAWPIVEHLNPVLTYSRLIDVAFFNSYIAMLLGGYYIKKYVTPSKKLFILAAVVFVACVMFSVVMTYREYQLTAGTNYMFYDHHLYLPAMLQTGCVFYMATHISLKGALSKVLKVVGGCTFGIYLVVDFFSVNFQSIYLGLRDRGVNAMIAVVVYQVTLFAVGFVVAFVLKHIPIIKKLL